MTTATAELLSLPAAATAIGVSYFALLYQLRRHKELDGRVQRVSGRRVLTADQLAELRGLITQRTRP